MGYKRLRAKQQQPRKLPISLWAAQPSAEPHYDRAKPKPLRELFPKSSPAAEYFIQYKEKLALEIAHKVAHDLLKMPEFGPGDYKLVLRPAGGGKAAFLFESLRHTDIIGLKLIKGEHNGEEVRVVEMRYKKKASVAQKGIELELGAPRMRAEMSADTCADALSDLRMAMDDPDVSPGKKEKLALLLSALEAERHGQERMFMEACGNDPKTIEKARSILAKISAQLGALEGAAQEIVNENESDEAKMSVASHVGAIALCPFVQEKQQSEEFFKSLSAGSRDLLGYISKSCLTEILPSVYGVEILEHTTIDSINQLQNLLRLLHSQTSPLSEGLVCRMVGDFDAKFEQLHKMVAGAARDRETLPAQSALYNSERWFLKLCSTMNSRKKLLHEIEELEKIANRLENRAYRLHAKKIIANMAFNLCRVDAREASLFEMFFQHPGVRKDMKEWQSGKYRKTPLHGMRPMLERFLKAAAEEAKRAEGHFRKEAEAEGEGKSANEARHRFKEIKAKADANLRRLIFELEEAAPALGSILHEYFRRSKMHVSYKQLEALPKSPENMLTRLAIAQRLFESEGDIGKKTEYAERVTSYLEEASALFAIFWSNHDSRKAIFDVIKPTRYVQEKGFDMAGDPAKHISRGNTTGRLFVDYRASQAWGNGLEVMFEGNVHHIPLDYAHLYEAGYLPLRFTDSEKSVREDIFGRRIPLSEVMPFLSGKGPQDIFRELYYLSNHDPEKFSEVCEDMKSMNMGNARFPSTIAFERNRHSGCVASFGGAVVENLPLKCNESAPNTFAFSFERIYPDAEDGEMDARKFVHQQVARRAVGALAVNKFSIAREYIRSVLAEKS